jgi:hypothetical protein
MSLMRTMIDQLGKDGGLHVRSPAQPAEGVADSPAALFVATDLELREFDRVGGGERDIEHPGTCQVPAAEHREEGWLFPAGEAWKCRQPVTARAVAKVDAIRQEAEACGWSEARLYQNQGRYGFPCGQDYGLVCFVDGDREIGAVTERFIEIVHGAKTPRPGTLRFYNPDVPQPWRKKVEANE